MSPSTVPNAPARRRVQDGGTPGWWPNGDHRSGARRVTSHHVRPTLLGYIRADVLRDGAEIPRMEAQLQAFADTEEFSLGTIYVEQRNASGAFHALMAAMGRDDAARGVVIPDLRHLTVVEQRAC